MTDPELRDFARALLREVTLAESLLYAACSRAGEYIRGDTCASYETQEELNALYCDVKKFRRKREKELGPSAPVKE